MIHLSPSNLVAYEQIDHPDSPWMTKAKFKAQFLGQDVFSEKAEAGNAVHDAALGGAQIKCDRCNGAGTLSDLSRCPSCEGCGVTALCSACHGEGIVDDLVGEVAVKNVCPDCDGRLSPAWLVSPELIEAIQSHLRGEGLPETMFVLYGKDFGITEFDLRLSMRFDYLTLEPRILHELKTTGELHIHRYANSAQILAYKVALGLPVVVIGAEIKIKKRGRLGRKGDVSLVRHEEKVCEPQPDDKERLRDLVLRCTRYVMDDEDMRTRAMNRNEPELL